MNYTTIKVSKNDIRLGRNFTANGRKCPIARAILRQTKLSNFWIAITRILHDPDYSKPPIATLPKIAQIFQYRLISGQKVKPFTFKVKLPN